jgi:hypothetical protein
MAANGTNQSQLQSLTRPTYNNTLNNQRAQAYTRNNNPNTAYNGGSGSNMFSNSQYSQWMPTSGTGQNPNLGRYVPPMMNPSDYGWGGNPNSWMHQGGYAYNTPQAYTGFPGAGGGSPFNYWGGGAGGMTQQPFMNGQGWGGNQGFQQMLQQLYQQMFGGQQQPGMGGVPDGQIQFGFGTYGPNGRAQPGWYEPQTPDIGRDNRMIPGGGAGIAPNPQIGTGMNPGVGGSGGAPSVGGAGGGGISRPGGGMSAGTVAPSPVGGVTNAPPQQPRLWWGGNGGG